MRALAIVVMTSTVSILSGQRNINVMVIHSAWNYTGVRPATDAAI